MPIRYPIAKQCCQSREMRTLPGLLCTIQQMGLSLGWERYAGSRPSVRGTLQREHRLGLGQLRNSLLVPLDLLLGGRR